MQKQSTYPEKSSEAKTRDPDPSLILDNEPNVFGFFEDEEMASSDRDRNSQQHSKIQTKQDSKRNYPANKSSVDNNIDDDKLPHVDLTENPDYLLHFSYSNGFVWNEEVLLSPPFYSSSFGSSPGSQSSSQQNRVFPALMAERIRRQRIAQETKVAEIRFDD